MSPFWLGSRQSLSRLAWPQNARVGIRRCLSSGPVPPPSSAPANVASQVSEKVISSREVTRLQRINDRLPKFVRRWTTPLLRAPASQVISFLLLHEATAVVPLFGLVGVMHYTNWMPPFAESAWVVAGIEKFGKYARRKGWLKDADVQAAEGRIVKAQKEEDQEEEKQKQGWLRKKWNTTKAAWQKRETIYGRGETGVRLLVEFATAWAVVKALLIPRLALSVWATPWFARLAVEPVMRMMARRGGKLLDGSKKAS